MARLKPPDQLSPAYARRIANALKRGLSRSQARGHARIEKGELPATIVSLKARRKTSRSKAAKVVKIYTQTGDFKGALKRAKMSRRAFIKANREGAPYLEIKPPSAPFQPSEITLLKITVNLITASGEDSGALEFAGADMAVIRDYTEALKIARRTGDYSGMARFRRKSVTDIIGTRYRLITNKRTIEAFFKTTSEELHDNFLEATYVDEG